jgi:hypothetical protein
VLIDSGCSRASRQGSPSPPGRNASRCSNARTDCIQLTVSFAIDVTARDFPTLTVFRELSEGEVDFAEWAATTVMSYFRRQTNVYIAGRA